MALNTGLTFTQTQAQLINDAFQLIGVYGVGRTVSSEDYNFASNLLNKMVKSWESRGLHLWTKGECVLYPIQYTAQYTLGNGAYCTDINNQIVAQTTANAASAASAIVVNTTTGMATNDYIVIQLSTGALQYNTISSISNLTINLTNPLIASVNSVAMVYAFNTMLPKPLRITNGRLLSGFDSGATSTLYEIQLTSISYEDYMSLPVKTVNGMTNQFHYNPQDTQGMLYLWPRPTGYDQRLQFSYERSIDDLNLQSDNFDFPIEWYECLTYQLALRLGPPFGKDQKALQSIAPMAQEMYDNLLHWDSEINSVCLQPNLRGR